MDKSIYKLGFSEDHAIGWQPVVITPEPASGDNLGSSGTDLSRAAVHNCIQGKRVSLQRQCHLHRILIQQDRWGPSNSPWILILSTVPDQY